MVRDPIRWLPQYSYVIFQIVDEVVYVKNISKLPAESDKIGQIFCCLILGWKIITTKTQLYKSEIHGNKTTNYSESPVLQRN